MGVLRTLALALAACPWACSAQSSDLPYRIEITGRSEPPGSTLRHMPSVVTTIDRQEIDRTNVGRDYTDLLRRVPGVNAYSFGQGDIGSPIKMRGFVGTGSHGGDVAVYIDGVPQNFPSANQGGPGMSDLSWLTPAMIERIEVIKGPFSALFGDQNRAGAINIVTRDRSESQVALTRGSFDTTRASGTWSTILGRVDMLLVADVYDTQGYRDNSDGTRGALMVKASNRFGGARWALRANHYDSKWNAPGYLNFAALQAGTVRPTDCDPNSPPPFGSADRSMLVLTRVPEPGAGPAATLYAERYRKQRGLGSGVSQYNVQNDRRSIGGGRILQDFNLADVRVTVGVELRLDDGVGRNERWPTVTGPGPNVNNWWDMRLLTYGAFAQGQWALSPAVDVLAGVRVDAFDYEIKNIKRPAASIDYDSHVTTPRIGVNWRVASGISVFANVGEGFRSPAERELSPPGALGPPGAAGGAPQPQLKAPKVKAYDLGGQFEAGAWRGGLSAYHTLNRNEIREVPPSGSGNFASIGDTTRDGVEVELRWDATPMLVLSTSYGGVRGRVRNPAIPGQVLINGLPRDTFRAGLEATVPLSSGSLAFNFDAFLIDKSPYYLGTSPIVQINPRYTRYDLRGTWRDGPLSLTGSWTIQPNRLAAEQAGTSIDPRPRNDLSVTAAYRF